MSFSRTVTIDPQILTSSQGDRLSKRSYRFPSDLFADERRIFSEKAMAKYFEDKSFAVKKSTACDRTFYPVLKVKGLVEIHFFTDENVIFYFGKGRENEFSVKFTRSKGLINSVSVRVQVPLSFMTTVTLNDCYLYTETFESSEHIDLLRYLKVFFLRELEDLDDDALEIVFDYEDDYPKSFGKSQTKFTFLNRGLTSTFDVGECDVPDRKTAKEMIRKSILAQIFF